MRKLKVNTKLAARKINRLDNTDKFGLAFGLVFILPAIVLLISDVLTNGSNLI